MNSESRAVRWPRGETAQGAACVQAFREQFDFVYRCVRRLGATAADIDDLVQEVFIAMWRRWADFDDTRPLRPWLAGIAFRVVRCHARRRPPEVVRFGNGNGDSEGLLLDLADGSQDADRWHAASDARALVLSAIDRLPERHRLPLVMHELDELTPNEIAALLEVPLATVYTRVRRARMAFAKVVTQLQNTGRAQLRFTALTPEALLALERAPGKAPEVARARAHRFAQQVVDGRVLPPDPLERLPPSRPPAAGSSWGHNPLGFGLAVLAAAGVLGLLGLLVGRLAASGRGRVTAVTAAAPGQGPALERVRRTRAATVPALRAAPPAPFLPPPVAPAALARGLTGYWSFDDGAGAAVIRDVSGAARHCRLHGSPGGWIQGVSGRAVALDARVWFDCPQPAVWRQDPGAISVAAWVKRRSERFPAAVATRQIDRGYHDHFFFGFGQDTLKVHSHAWAGGVAVAAPPPSERWFHVAFTHDRDGLTRLYMQGVVVGEYRGAPTGSGPIDTPITIGAGRFGAHPEQVRQRLDGALDDVLIYDRALSSEEVGALAGGIRPAAADPAGP